jgi:RNA polymerase sigma-70 factor (ECF subfamily)
VSNTDSIPASSLEPSSTSLTLLGRIRNNDGDAWELFVTLYSRLVYRWCRNRGLQQDDAADVMQDVFQQVATSVDQFQRRRNSDGLRRWLATITRNKINDFYRRQGRQPPGRGGSTGLMILQQQLQPSTDAVDEDSSLDLTTRLRMILNRIQTDFAGPSWKAFEQVVLRGRSVADVAADLDLSSNAVRIAKCRILKRLRGELQINDNE